MEKLKKKPDKINALLDIDMFSGSSGKRMMPIVIFNIVACLPFVLYAGFLIKYLPFAIYLIFQIIWAGRWALIILMDEAERKEKFKRQINDEYGSIEELLGIRKVHEDGCIEYIDGRISFIVVTYNASSNDKLMRAQHVKKFISSLNERYTTDVYVHNIVDYEQISKRYSSIKMLNDAEVSSNFIEMIDNTTRLIKEYSMLKATYYVTKGRRADYGEMKESLAPLVNDKYSHIYKQIYLADYDEVVSTLARDLNIFIDLDEVLMKKYRKGKYYGSKVIKYDEDWKLDNLETEVEKKSEHGFMVQD